MATGNRSPIRTSIVGAGGRMGLLLTEIIATDPRFELVGLLETDEFPHLGQVALESHPSVVYSSNMEIALGPSEIIIDFSLPMGTLAAIEYAANHKKGFITGTTGFNSDESAIIREYSQYIPVLQASNMSIGITVLSELLNHLRTLIPENFDLEIIERHHRYKKDSPSGTALHLAQLLTGGKKENSSKIVKVGRNRGNEPRQESDLVIHSIRGGGIIGEHSVFCIGESEEICISHRAFDRRIFVSGAVEAALFIADVPAGLYSMKDVLGHIDL